MCKLKLKIAGAFLRGMITSGSQIPSKRPKSNWQTSLDVVPKMCAILVLIDQKILPAITKLYFICNGWTAPRKQRKNTMKKTLAKGSTIQTL